ncbi:hypothetical protein L873DRAFT_1844030 [Choiromyces venosus 120613-1]|uniref:Uncharacterized protein n=1 Tax=Choiromyces venosus 120613-1 TaxID=1336337 RepID=A0A3N4JKB5_9PEZI|nr:hypothetical protein L873DRAFT_1844030 [Choiromyces venosus 120613-1]
MSKSVRFDPIIVKREYSPAVAGPSEPNVARRLFDDLDDYRRYDNMFDANGDPIVPFASPASPASTPDAPTELASDWDHVSSGVSLQVDAAKNIFRFDHDLPVVNGAPNVPIERSELRTEWSLMAGNATTGPDIAYVYGKVFTSRWCCWAKAREGIEYAIMTALNPKMLADMVLPLLALYNARYVQVYGIAFGVDVSTGTLLYERLVEKINRRDRLNKRCTARKRGTKANRQRREYLKRREEDYGQDIERLVMRYITDLEETMIDVFGPEESCMLCDINLEMDLEMEELEYEFDL